MVFIMKLKKILKQSPWTTIKEGSKFTRSTFFHIPYSDTDYDKVLERGLLEIL